MFDATLTVSSSFPPMRHGNPEVVASLLFDFVERGVPMFDASEWRESDIAVVSGLLRRLRCQIDHADAVLCSALRTEGRDANARVARTFQVSPAAASRLRQVSDIVWKCPEVGALLRDGVLAETHVRALHVVADEPPETINRLACSSVGLGVAEFENVLKQHLIDKDDGVTLRERQKNTVGLRFGTDGLGLTTMNAKLFPEDGVQLRALIERLTSERWREEHPTRSAVFQPLLGDQSFAYRNLETLKQLLECTQTSGIGSAATRPAVIVVVDAESGSAEIVGQGPVAPHTVTELLKQNADLFVGTRRPSTATNNTVNSKSAPTGNGNGAANGAAANTGNTKNAPTETGNAFADGATANTAVRMANALSAYGATAKPAIAVANAPAAKGCSEVARAQSFERRDLASINRIRRGTRLYDSIIERSGPLGELVSEYRKERVNPLDADPKRRYPTLPQELVICVRDQRCVIPGCNAAHRACEIHHIIEYDNDGPTVIANLVLLCKAHHHWLHNNKYRIKRNENGTIDVIDRNNNAIVYGRGPPETT